MTTEANYMGWTYDEAANRHADLDDAKEQLTKAIESLKEAQFPYNALNEIVGEIKTEMTNMSFVMAACKQIEEKAAVRLGGEL